MFNKFNSIAKLISDSLISIAARIGIAATFWQSGQTKIENFVFNIFTGEVKIGLPRLSENAVILFQEEYKLPLLNPTFAATSAAIAEHVFPVLILVGLATRVSAFALLVMTAVIQIFVYPLAYPTHLLWATALLFLIAKGAGRWSVDAVFRK